MTGAASDLEVLLAQLAERRHERGRHRADGKATARRPRRFGTRAQHAPLCPWRMRTGFLSLLFGQADRRLRPGRVRLCRCGVLERQRGDGTWTRVLDGVV